MNRLLCAFVFLLPMAAPGAQRYAVNPDLPQAAWVVEPSPPLTPEQSMATFDLPPGFRAELVASEPLIGDPIDIAFGPDGRLWVVELPSYNWPDRANLGLEAAERPDDRIVVLEDTNGDGRYDKRTVFKDGLDGPRTVTVVAGGVLVAMPPQVWFFRDTTGDGVADYEEKLLDDYGPRANPHVMPNSLIWAMDNWIYSARYGARLRWDNGKWERDEPVVSRGQWGITQDNWGRLYYNHQSDPLRADLVRPAYWRRNPNFPDNAGINIRLAHDRSVSTHAPTPGVQPVHLNEEGKLFRFTSACTPAVYRGENFPSDMVGDVFVCVPTANFVRQFVLTGEDDAVVANNAYDGHEFFFAHDERVRPVHAYSGPDGALYIVDMYRGIIEGHLFIKDSMRDYAAARGLIEPFNGLGRIYRIVHEDKPAGQWPSFHRESPEQWVSHLSHPNGWWRDTAQRLLVEARAADMAPALRPLAADLKAEPHVRLHALWTLHGVGALDAASVMRALGDPSFRVREAALHLAEPWLGDPKVFSAVLALAGDERVEVRRQLLFTLGEIRTEAAEAAMRSVLLRDADRPWMGEAALSGLHGREQTFLEKTLSDSGWRVAPDGGDRLVQIFARAVVNEGEPDRLARLAQMAAREGWWQRPILAGMREGRRSNLARSPEAVRTLLNLSDPTLRERAADLIAAANRPDDENRVNLGGLDERARALYERGRVAYQLCASCHQPDGKGLNEVAPALADSPWMIRNPEGMIRITLHGIASGGNLPPMGSFGSLDDEQLASILTYLRLTFGRGRAILPEDVRNVRERTAGRTLPWTPEELRDLY